MQADLLPNVICRVSCMPAVGPLYVGLLCMWWFVWDDAGGFCTVFVGCVTGYEPI